jgi:hypothetical protein
MKYQEKKSRVLLRDKGEMLKNERDDQWAQALIWLPLSTAFPSVPTYSSFLGFLGVKGRYWV